MISRRAWLIAAVLLPACTSRKSDGPPPFPNYAGEWTLKSGPEDTEGVTGSKAAWIATYSGNPDVRVVICRMGAQAVAFDHVQKWRAEPGKLAFFKGPYFGIAEAAGADQPTLNRFVTAIQTGLPEN